MKKNKRCDAMIEKGYWKGSTCGNNAILKLGKEYYCAVHYGIMIKKEKQVNK
jgi:hypothetical protein